MNPVESYKVADGYVSEDGLHWDSLADFLHCHVLNFCGCGNADSCLKITHDMLVMRERHLHTTNYHEQETEIKEYVQEHWEEFAQFFWFVMDAKDILEHGSSIPGWVRDENFLAALKQWKKEEQKYV